MKYGKKANHERSNKIIMEWSKSPRRKYRVVTYKRIPDYYETFRWDRLATIVIVTTGLIIYAWVTLGGK